MKGYHLDPDCDIVSECYALIYAPRRQRTRFPENVVQVLASEEETINKATERQKFYPAKVIGPCRSSEGVNVYYLVKWLDE